MDGDEENLSTKLSYFHHQVVLSILNLHASLATLQHYILHNYVCMICSSSILQPQPQTTSAHYSTAYNYKLQLQLKPSFHLSDSIA
jgi:hypothetical protein